MKITNQSGLRPLGHAVLVLPEQLKMKTELIVPAAVQSQDAVLQQLVKVIEVGPMAWKSQGFEEPARAAPGDHVLISKFAGHLAVSRKDGQHYRFVNDRDIFGAVDVEEENG